MAGNGIFCTLDELFYEGLKSGKKHLHLRRRAMAISGGQKRSSVRGRGMEFLESRPYVAQDEIRHIDWKVSARLNGLFTKIFVEEKERPIYLVVDLRSQMFFGSRQCFKSVLAALIAARLSFAAINGGDTVGGFVFTNDSHCEIPPRSNKNGLARLFGELAHQTKNSHQDDKNLAPNCWTAVFSELRSRIAKGSALFLLSDFYGLDKGCHHALYALRKKADVFALKISDPLEQALPRIGLVGAAFSDQRVYFNSDDMILQKNFSQQVETRENSEDQLFLSLNIPKLKFSTERDLDTDLRPLFTGHW